MNRAVFKKLLQRKTLLWTAGGLAAAWLLAWYAVPWLVPLPEGLLHPEERGAVVLDRDGGRIATLPGPDYYHTEPVRLREVPDMLLKATLAAEDKRFFSHGGADFLALARAAAANAAGGEVVSGASTITQQLAKNANPPARRNLWTKAREFFQARRMEMSMSKEEILESYFNLLDYGNLRRGPAAAARFYFGREMSRLSLAECALLAGLPQGPSFLNPLRHPERALERRNRVLRRLEEEGMFPADMVNRALQEPLFSAGTEEGRQPAAPHVTAALMHAGRTGEVRTTLDASLQRSALEIVRRELERLKGHHVTQAAVIVVENATGNILCLVGSADRKHPAGGLMDGTSLPRSPGSALKPFVYAQAFVLGAYPGTVLPDVPTTYRSAHGLEAPQNYNRAYMGPVSVRQALACSQNIPAMRVLDTFGGPSRLLKLLENLGIRGIQGDAAHYGLGLAIGNAEVTLRDLTGAYACLARGGSFLPLKLEQGASVPERPVLPAEACFMAADILADREARMAAFHDRELMNLPFRYACKTGTSSDFRDNWCVGFTREITVGVWVGNFDASPMKQVGGHGWSGPHFCRGHEAGSPQSCPFLPRSPSRHGAHPH
ncbi:transglycosylase domain-containing protein [Akkermansia massiliensis]|uniref:transglycosylase domain-containing protein n=1 Tax=Akkermansia massiliensis TaxID=2927224 RepID=UPI001C06097B|nr:transglycosylase domain-containing protein [Akkermansia massiliensis]QWP04012.1 transglycosylase domain-containing protein [Akkermansia massiliensis]